MVLKDNNENRNSRKQILLKLKLKRNYPLISKLYTFIKEK